MSCHPPPPPPRSAIAHPLFLPVAIILQSPLLRRRCHGSGRDTSRRDLERLIRARQPLPPTTPSGSPRLPLSGPLGTRIWRATARVHRLRWGVLAGRERLGLCRPLRSTLSPCRARRPFPIEPARRTGACLLMALQIGVQRATRVLERGARPAVRNHYCEGTSSGRAQALRSRNSPVRANVAGKLRGKFLF